MLLVIGYWLLGKRLRLEVGFFPAQAFGSGWVGEHDGAVVGVVDVPLLFGITETDVRGSDDLESPERTEINRFGVEAVDVTTGGEAKGLAHGYESPPPICCWF